MKNYSEQRDLARQILRSGTSVGVNVSEAVNGYSKKEFRMKLQIALKEAAETNYWLDLFHETEYINDKMFESLSADCTEIIKILTAIINSSKKEDDLL